MLGNLKKVTYLSNENWIIFETHVRIILSHQMCHLLYISYLCNNVNLGNLITVTYNGGNLTKVTYSSSYMSWEEHLKISDININSKYPINMSMYIKMG